MEAHEWRTLSEGWEWKGLGEILELIRNGISTKQNEEKEGYPVTRIETISKGKINREKIGYVREDYNTILKYKMISGDILFSHINSAEHIGKTAIFENESDDLYQGVNLLLLRPNKGIVFPKYLLFYLKEPEVRKYFETRCKKAVNQASLNQKDILQIKIPLPPFPTQRRIVSILEKAEETKKLRAQADELADRLLQSVFLEMFGEPVRNPKGWEIKRLDHISEIVSGVTKGRKLSGNSVVSVPYLRVANVQDGFLDLKEIKTIDALPSEVEKFALLEGDILLTEGGDPDKLGRGAVWHHNIPNCIHQNHIFRVRVDKKSIAPEFLSMLIGSAYGKMFFLKSAKQTTGIATINSTQLKNFPVLVPPFELQSKFEFIVEKIESMRQSQNQSKHQIEDLFSTLMQRAFRGEI